MVNKGFPSFGMSQAGSFVATLKNYNLPDFILALVAKDCDSGLLERGRIDDRLQSMNDKALEVLHKVFVNCEEDDKGKFAQYRFFAYISSMYHKCEILINETIPGGSGKNHIFFHSGTPYGLVLLVSVRFILCLCHHSREAEKFY